MTVAIVCVGNRLRPEDALGPRVFDRLNLAARGEARSEIGEGIALIDGGLRGLDLLPAIERASHVVFVDAVARERPDADAYGEGDAIVEVGALDAITPRASGWDHQGGLAWLLHALPHVCEGTPPSWALIGAAGEPDDALVDAVASRALACARDAVRATRVAKAAHAAEVAP
jgi:hydrogenase maturation protease